MSDKMPWDVVAPPGTVMTQWVIYQRPKDFPSGYVMRPHHVMKDGTTQPDAFGWFHESVDVLREFVPDGLVRIPRFANDDPVILEVWT